MRLYDNAWASKYEEIKTWYPVWYRDVFEMDALWRIWGNQLDEIQAGIIQAVDNNFVDFADAQTIGKMETFLGIVYGGPRTLSERRNVIKAFLMGTGHIGQQEIKNLISVFTDGVIVVALIGGKIQVSITQDFGDQFNLYDCHLVLDNRIPAHLALELVDALLPLSFVNHEEFFFRKLNIKFAVKESSAMADGALLDGDNLLDGTWLLSAAYQSVRFVRFKVKSDFHNYGVQEQGAMPNGQEYLDGSWPLDAIRQEIFSGMAPKRLDMSAYVFKNTFGVTAKSQFALSVQNKNDLLYTKTHFSGLSVKQEYNLTGKVVMDSRWALDGVYSLNGSRSLKSILIEEAI